VVVDLCQVVTLDRASAAFFRADATSLTIRLEDLVREPERELRRLCELIGVGYDPQMIERRGIADLAAEHEWWKQGASEPLDPARLGRWRAELSPEHQAFAALHCHALLAEYRYEGAREPRARLAVVPLAERVAAEDESFLLELSRHDTIVAQPAPLTPGALSRFETVVFWGEPGQLGLRLGTQRSRRLRGLARVVLDLGRRRVRGQPAMWVRRRTSWKIRSGDRSEQVLVRALGQLADQVGPREVPDLVSANGRNGRMPTDPAPSGTTASSDAASTNGSPTADTRARR
jgi:hypothetical protein